MKARLGWAHCAVIAASFATVFGCRGNGSSTREIQAAAGHDTLATTDWRRPWVGQWTVEFFVDSVRSGGSLNAWKAATGARAVGTLTITNILVPRHQLASRLSVPLSDVMGQPVSCFDPLPASIALESLSADSVRIAFTPNAFDCGITGTLTRHGTAAEGEWWENSFGGPVVLGRLRLRRTS
jgi:hypothetical protein